MKCSVVGDGEIGSGKNQRGLTRPKMGMLSHAPGA